MLFYIILICHWFDIIVLNVHAPAENQINDLKDSFYEKLENVFDKFLEYHKKMLLDNFSAEIEKIFSNQQQLGIRVYMKLLMIIELVL
jgi:hypothetical protein